MTKALPIFLELMVQVRETHQGKSEWERLGSGYKAGLFSTHTVLLGKTSPIFTFVSSQLFLLSPPYPSSHPST